MENPKEAVSVTLKKERSLGQCNTLKRRKNRIGSPKLGGWDSERLDAGRLGGWEAIKVKKCMLGSWRYGSWKVMRFGG
jgi:hypothetical protein